MQNNSKKLTLEGYSDEQFQSKVGEPFHVQINPEKFSHTRSIQLNTEEKASNTSGSVAAFEGYDNDEVSFELIFDGTGVVSDIEVGAKLQALEDVIFKYEGNQHKPNYVKISWGDFIFNSMLKQFSTEYTLFKEDGVPLRAKVSLAFVGFVDAETREKRANNSSPDLTHVKEIRQGDSLPILCKEIYGNNKYYLQIAAINGITNFRRLKPGMKIIFPPIEK